MLVGKLYSRSPSLKLYVRISNELDENGAVEKVIKKEGEDGQKGLKNAAIRKIEVLLIA